MKKLIVLLAFALSPLALLAQGASNLSFRIDATTNGTTIQMSAVEGNFSVRDDDSQGDGAPDAGSPMRGIDYYVVVEGNCTGEKRLALYVDELSIHCLDTLYIYDGDSPSAPLLKKFNSYYGGVSAGDYIFISAANTSNKVCIRFVTDDLSDPARTSLPCFENSDGIGNGFALTPMCKKPCEWSAPVIDSVYYRVRNGVVYDSAKIRDVLIYDTAWVDSEDHSLGFDSITTLSFTGAHLCIGDGVIFKGHGEYTYNYGYYTPSDATTLFKWDFANDNDTLVGVGLTNAYYEDYQQTGCYDLKLQIVDEFGCGTLEYNSIRVRTSGNPIKTIFTLSDICNNSSLRVNMGYSGENATLTLREVENAETVSKTFECVTFIPDGCDCTDPSYFEAPVEFNEFPNNRRVRSAKDICSICINMEHTFMGDIYITIVCPSDQEAMLKFGNPSSCSPYGLPATDPEGGPAGAHGSGTNLGWPTHNDGSKCSDPWENPYGIGLDYCFSRDLDYTLVTGDNAGAQIGRPVGDFYIGSNNNNYNIIRTDDPDYGVTALPSPLPPYVDEMGTPHPFTRDPSLYGSQTRKPSNHEGKFDYYLPYTEFNELIGCPLNGTWKIRVYDTWGADNGWIFNWSMDICNVSTDNDCKYTVGIDSLIWRPNPDPQYHDYDLGHYRGLRVDAETPTVSHISSPDTAGTFPIDVLVYDEFGCIWDTATRITTYWTPEPNLGADTMLCGVDQTQLNAIDRHSATENYIYMWAPFGEDTPEITTHYEPSGDIDYVVRVVNRHGISCYASDTIHVALRKQPIPNFIPEPFRFEGCAPMTLTFNNQTIDGYKYFWDFGDGITSELESPTHTYAEGIYTLKYYATSSEGCIDSVISDGAIAVYPTPKSAFTWNPVYPSVLNPVVALQNNVEPKVPENRYFWEMQYNRDNPLSVQTYTSEDLVYDFSEYANENEVSGAYGVRLIARSDNIAPSGRLVQCADTAANTILVINDFLQFPNVVSPNGDGVNDRFVIQNLVEGMGYPINTLDIYNKWGSRVYHKENITKDSDFWNPEGMPAGTYFYRFSAHGYNGNIEHNGSIEVVY